MTQTQAIKAKKTVLKGTAIIKKQSKKSTSFHLPKTLRLPRQPKYIRKSVVSQKTLDAFKVIKAPMATESAMQKIEDDNTLVFLCDTRATKMQIKLAVKRLYDVDAIKINTLIRPDGQKKAYVRLTADVEALDVANKIGLV